ncbi:hypothetical protein [Nonomuraea dietziae]|uniref:hypothetical protein n=1 Tax=Nonomuraea dietziae TaxID=65515 RepID=UPI003CD07978
MILNAHVDDFDAVEAQLRAAGVEWLVPVADRPSGRFGTFADPDGNYLRSSSSRRTHKASGRRRGHRPRAGKSRSCGGLSRRRRRAGLRGGSVRIVALRLEGLHSVPGLQVYRRGMTQKHRLQPGVGALGVHAAHRRAAAAGGRVDALFADAVQALARPSVRGCGWSSVQPGARGAGCRTGGAGRTAAARSSPSP